MLQFVGRISNREASIPLNTGGQGQVEHQQLDASRFSHASPQENRDRRGGHGPELAGSVYQLVKQSDSEAFTVRYPKQYSIAKNRPQHLVDVYLPGVGADRAHTELFTQTLANVVGGPVVGVNNDAGVLGIPGGVVNGFLGMVSPKLGAVVEGDTILNLKKLLRARIHEEARNKETGEPTPEFRLHLHSQGGIIGQNALWLLREELGPNSKEWKNIASSLTVRLYGSPVQDWPPEIKVDSFVFSGDFPAHALGVTSSLLYSLSGREGRKPNQFVIPGFSHRLAYYIADFEKFELERLHSTEKSGRPEDQIFKLQKDGLFSDQTIQKMNVMYR